MDEWLRCTAWSDKALCSNLINTIHGITLDKLPTTKCQGEGMGVSMKLKGKYSPLSLKHLQHIRSVAYATLRVAH